MKTIYKFTAALCLLMTIALAGCESINRRDAGTVVGGVGGGVLGSALTGGNTVGTIAGALGGAYAGNQLAK